MEAYLKSWCFFWVFPQEPELKRTERLSTLGEGAERRYTRDVSASLLESVGPIFCLPASQPALAKGKRLGAVRGPFVPGAV